MTWPACDALDESASSSTTVRFESNGSVLPDGAGLGLDDAVGAGVGAIG